MGGKAGRMKISENKHQIYKNRACYKTSTGSYGIAGSGWDAFQAGLTPATGAHRSKEPGRAIGNSATHLCISVLCSKCPRLGSLWWSYPNLFLSRLSITCSSSLLNKLGFSVVPCPYFSVIFSPWQRACLRTWIQVW